MIHGAALSSPSLILFLEETLPSIPSPASELFYRGRFWELFVRWCMGQEEEAVLVPAAAVFSWEYEQAVKLNAAAEEEGRVSGSMPESPVKKAAAPTRRLSVPPPPGRGRAASLGTTRSLSRAYRYVRPEDDPFLAAYLACTKSGGDGGGKRRSAANREQRGLLAWAGLGLSCKRSNGVVEESMVRLGKLPDLNPMDS